MEISHSAVDLDYHDLHSNPVLVVDLDGTLLQSDLLLETGMAFLRSQPLRLLEPLVWLAKGKASLKEGLALATDIDISVLPYDLAVIDLIKSERRKGRVVVLATASHHSLADRIAEHLNLFDQVLATNADRNLSAHRKRDLLIESFGERGFDYVGNAHDDVPVWAAARQAYIVNPESGVEERTRKHGNVTRVIRSNPPCIREWISALRLHQWLKNALIFVPLLAAHQLNSPQLIWQGILAFLFFGLCASSVYLFNDILDLGDDRHHHSKRHRPFAAGRVQIKSGLIACPVLLVLAFGGSALLLPWAFVGILAAYYILTLLYSLSLKRIMTVDVIALSMLYTMRIIAGAAAFSLPLTFWILAFSLFMFFSLAMVKRYTELHEARGRGHTGKTRGRGYFPDDLEMISSLGATSGYVAVLILALYIHEQSTVELYTHPQFIWLACPLLLFWVTRVWMLTHRGEMHDDPIIFAIRDRTSMVVGVLFGLAFWMAV